jgi:hypothetical protein
MADEKKLADIVTEVESCPPGSCHDLTEAQIHALYHFKHRFVASLHRLYMTVPAGRADQVVGPLLKRVVDELG